MSLPEVGYRANQYLQKQKEKRRNLNIHHTQNYSQVLDDSLKSYFTAVPGHLAEDLINYKKFDFFGYSLDLYDKIDWHLDISSGKRFPLSFSKDIDIRSGEYGNAKIVWEINRLQFLLPLAIQYSVSKDSNLLTHWMRLVKSWTIENPYLKGVNWYSNIEINIRLIVWYYCWQILWQDEQLKKNEEFILFVKTIWLPTIYEHCVYSVSNPSKYSSANNHLVAEYSGLFVASCCWKFNEADHWNLGALKGLEKEIKLQFSDNGINKEQAAEYIQFVTDFFLIPYAIGQRSGIEFSNQYQNCLFKISDYISNLLDIRKNYRKYGDEDDGKVLIVSADPHFNNFTSILTSSAIIFNNERFKATGSDFDLKNWLLWGNEGKNRFDKIKTASLNLTSIFYENDGHFIFRKNEFPSREIYMHFDAAPLGFLSIAAHGHADALSVTLTIDGYPLIVDVGTYTYHTDKEWRNYFVSTVAHNTICIDQINQANQAGPTMWLNHYKLKVLKVEQREQLEMVSAKHYGYKKRGCVHTRTINFDKKKELINIEDQISVNSNKHSLLQPWHLHPDVSVETINEHSMILQNKTGGRKIMLKCDEKLQIKVVNGQLHPILGWYSNSFLVKEPTSVVVGEFTTTKTQDIRFNTSIQILDHAQQHKS